ncbi:ABC transporter permease [Enterococcus timonensis]|uniref:ABC transporter permease n=1 Tax=Enterococcus timonensis TaxID=1852364 RepID=UPI0008D97D1C|nr:ABC transporter permease [Enterococcus timonensis]
MIEQFRLDFKRNFLTSFNVVILLAFALVLLSGFLNDLNSDVAINQSTTFTAIKSASATIQERIKGLNENPEENAEMLTAEKARLKYVQDMILLTAGPFDAQELNQLYLNYAKYNLQEIQAGRGESVVLLPFPDKELNVTETELKKDIALYEYLIAHQMAEVPSYFIKVPAIHYLTNTLLYRVPIFILLLFFCIQLAQLFTIDKHNGTSQLLNDAPTKKIKLLTSKIFTFFALTLPLFFIALGIVFLLNVSLYGLGQLDYPLIVSTGAESFQILTMANFLLLYLLLLLVILIFLATLSAFSSLFSGNFGVNLFVLVVPILLMQSGILASGFLRKIAKFLPSSYLEVGKFLIRTTPWPVGSLTTGLSVLLLSAALCYVLSALVLQKRQAL